LLALIALSFGTISQALYGAFRGPLFDALIRSVGAALAVVIFAAVCSFLTKGLLRLFKVSLRAETFLAVFCAWAFVVGGITLAGQLFQSRRLAAIEHPANKQSFVFNPMGCEYSVVFAVRPDLSDTKTHLFERPIDGKLAMLLVPGGKGFFRAECYPVAEELTAQVTKEHAYKGMQMIAEAAGIREYQLSYSEGEVGKLCKLRGTKTVSDPKGNAIRLMAN
jgi:hypothetical protein